MSIFASKLNSNFVTTQPIITYSIQPPHKKMNLTPEQLAIIQSAGNIKINAVAGSGKTTTIVEYARTRPKGSRILYLAFNRAVKLEAKKKFAKYGLGNVKIETAHSLAYRQVVKKYNYKVRHEEYKTYELADLLKLVGNGEKHSELVIANHIGKLASLFCNSKARKVQELDYFKSIQDKQAKAFALNHRTQIEGKTRKLLAMMNAGKMEISHDFYLKKFQLGNPVLPFDYILFDEGQDASPAMLDIFLNQKATKVIVGDSHQQIYAWRSAVNSLEQVDFAEYSLSNSFRFSQPIADLALNVLGWKELLKLTPPEKISGMGTEDRTKTRAILARTNLGLLLEAIEQVIEQGETKSIYFEGNINSYTYADEGASLYDVLNLYNGNHGKIKDSLIRRMDTLEDLEEFIEKTEDKQLGLMVKIVKKYKNEIYEIIRTLKEKHVGDDKKEEAELIFSTVHRCKGMEYDKVKLVGDFLNKELLEKILNEVKLENLDIGKLNEEINLLYVAITRTTNHLYLPENYLPEGFPKSSRIHPIATPKEEIEEEGSGVICELSETAIELLFSGNAITYSETESGEVEISNFSGSTQLPVVDASVEDSKAKSKKSEGQIASVSFGDSDSENSTEESEEKAYCYEEIRKEHKKAYEPWTPELDEELGELFRKELSQKELANHFGRTKGAISSRIKKLGLNA